MSTHASITAPALAAAIAMAAAAPLAAQTTPTAETGAAFLDQVDLARFARVAVYRDGRVKTFESFAREMMSFVSGRREIAGRPATVTYFDLMLRPEAYADADVIFVKSRLIRAQIVTALRSSMEKEIGVLRADVSAAGDFDRREPVLRSRLEARLERFRKTGLISEPMLRDGAVQALLRRLETDLLRSAKYVRMIDSALAVKDPELLSSALRVVPPPVGGGLDQPWTTLDAAAAGGGAGPEGPMHENLAARWSAFRAAWARGDAPAVNAAADQLAVLLPAVNAELYPDEARLAWESWYFRHRNMTWVWLFYALCLIPLVLHVVFRWRGARWAGLALFVLAFALHSFAVMLRWYVAQRWPNSNMFEAVTTSAWFGGCFALVIELLVRRLPVRGLFALGSAATSMVALMAVHFLPLDLSANIDNRMPVLNDVWLYIHTNVIIFSYGLIFIASISAFMYLLYRAGRALFGRGGGHGGAGEYARVGGAGSLIMTTPDGETYLNRARTTVGQVLDGTTMIVLELSFVLLWSGIVMGAIWADHSWGRPWGWDPKEVFALNTFLIFALLIHTRLKVRDKGLWTALLALAGCGVMLFNWIVINFTISGLHSYA